MPLFISSPGCASGPDMVEMTPTLISVWAAATPSPASDAPASASQKCELYACMPNPSLPPRAFDDVAVTIATRSRAGQASRQRRTCEREGSDHQVDQLAAIDRVRRDPI